MKKLFLFYLPLLLTISLKAQNPKNLDFEIIENENAKDWKEMGQGQYKVHFDQNIKHHGETSASIESIGENLNFKALGYHIPANFGGKKIKITGYIKTENVENGWAGLWMRIDPNIAFDNMKSRGVKGTNDWKKYEIELPLNNQAETIVVGGILVGSGKMWFDNLEVTIDGKSLEKVSEKELSKPELDKEFDNGSKITFRELNDPLLTNMELLGKLWGFLKYHHPEICKGNYNWDYELFRFIPKYLEVKNNQDRNQLLLNWINSYGEIKHCKNCKTTSVEAFLKPDHSWFNEFNLDDKLKTKLEYIYKNRHQGDSYYIDMMPRVGNPNFINENSYSQMPYPDTGFRLLALFRYWNMMQYFNPNKHLTDKDWITILKEYIPKFINANDELEYELAALQIIGEVKDTHANLWGGNNEIQNLRGKYFPPFHVRFVENKLVVDDYFNPELKSVTNLEIGDIITHINGKSVESLIEDNIKFYPASNQPTRLRNISFDILRSNSSMTTITFIHENKEITNDITLYEKDSLNLYYSYKKESDKKSYKMLSDSIGYITLKNIKKTDIETIKKDFKYAKGIIVDIRNYPSVFVPFSLGNFLNTNRTFFVKFTQANKNNPGEFTFRKGRKVGLNKSWSYQGNKIVVLVNEISQSQAEYTAMAFRAGNNTTIIGSTTAGADGNVSKIYLPGGLMTMISGIGVYYPDGTETQRVGIIPDIEVKPTIKGIKEGRDEVLEKAIEIIKSH